MDCQAYSVLFSLEDQLCLPPCLVKWFFSFHICRMQRYNHQVTYNEIQHSAMPWLTGTSIWLLADIGHCAGIALIPLGHMPWKEDGMFCDKVNWYCSLIMFCYIWFYLRLRQFLLLFIGSTMWWGADQLNL